jgi:hypothetical protein
MKKVTLLTLLAILCAAARSAPPPTPPRSLCLQSPSNTDWHTTCAAHLSRVPPALTWLQADARTSEGEALSLLVPGLFQSRSTSPVMSS